MRKVIMIACNPQLHALCEDGTIWQHVSPQGWRQVEAIPEEDDESRPVKPKPKPSIQNPPGDNTLPAPVTKVVE